MTLSQELLWRGFINQSTFADITELDNQQWTFYHGFDASADSQTIGNLAAMMIDKVFMRHGHKAILLAGGATSLIGDPGGKDKERELPDEAQIASNVLRAQQQMQIVFEGHEFVMVNNIDWTKNLTVLEFLRDVGKHFSMTNLVQRDYIAQRIGGSGISFTEFSYTLLQGNDYMHLHDNYGCNLQIGGSDQWGNCLSGVDLIRRARGHEVHALTLPLVINQATGKKFGKSEDGAVWLDSTKTSPYKFYQFWLNADDQGVETYLKIYTELDKATIDELMSAHAEEPHKRLAQSRLAQEVTRLVHGQQALDDVEQVTAAIFGNNDSGSELNSKLLEILEAEIPMIEVATTEELDLVSVLVDLGLVSSKTEARRSIEAGAIRLGISSAKLIEIDNQKAVSVQVSANTNDSRLLIRKGKNSVGLVKFV